MLAGRDDRADSCGVEAVVAEARGEIEERRIIRKKIAHSLFELKDLAAQGRLADVAGGRGSAEMAEIGHSNEILEITQVHA